MFLEVYKCLPSKGLCALIPRSLGSLGTEAYTFLGVITRRHAWEMIDCRWPDRGALAEKSWQAGGLRLFVCGEIGSSAVSATAKHAWQGAGAILGQGRLWFAVDIHSIESVNTQGPCGSGTLTERRWQSKEQNVGKSMNPM